MLWNSQVAQLFNKMGVIYSTQANNLRKQETAKALDLYHSEALKHLETRLQELFSEPEKMTKVTLNVIKKIIHQQATTFREPPTRILEGSEADQNLFAAICQDCSLDIVLKQCSRLLKLLKSLLLKVVWVDDKIRLDIIIGNIIEYIQTSDTPYDLKSVLIIDYGSSNRVEDVEYSFWDEEVFKRLDYRLNTIQEESNPYNGKLPFIPLFDTYNSSSSFWLPLDDSLISCQESINEKLTDLLYIIRQQGFGVGWIRSEAGTAGTLRTDPGVLVELQGEKSALGFESQQSEIAEIVDAIQKLISWTAISQGLSAGSMSTDPVEQSGLSKIVDTRELSEIRQDDLQLWRGYEREIFNTLRLVWNTHSKKKLSDSATLSIDFADPKAQIDPKTQATAWDLQLAMGVISAVDIAMEKNKDLKTREDALAFLLQVREEQRQLSE